MNEEPSAQQDAPANAGSTSQLQSSVVGPAWLLSEFDDRMKRLLITVWVFGAVAFSVVWLTAAIRAESKYDQMRKDLLGTLPVTRINEQTKAFLSDVQRNWTCRADIIDGPHSDGVKLAGFNPSVSNLIQVLNYQMPAYSWLSASQNRRAIAIGMVKAELFPKSVDKKIYVSEDGHLASIHCVTNAVYIFQDDGSKLRESLYCRKKHIEPEGPANGSQPIRSETNRTSSAAGSRR